MEDIEDLLYKDAFVKYLAKQIDYYEDLVYDTATNPSLWIEAKSKVEAFKEVRDEYAKSIKENTKPESKSLEEMLDEKKKAVFANYYWYDHCMLRGTGIDLDIEECIENHDWKKFKTYQKCLNGITVNGKAAEFLPNAVRVHYSNGKINSEYLTEDTFKLITCNEYECG